MLFNRVFSTSREFFFLLTHPHLWFRRPLSEKDMAASPFQQFERWYGAARRRLRGEFPNWLCLSTVSSDGRPQGRIVLLKEFDERGFVFYTNTDSAKGNALAHCPFASMTFYWDSLQHQVRIEGAITLVSDEEADRYFSSRPRGSQIGAWASLQSRPLASREELQQRIREIETQYSGKVIPRPPYWTGYRLIPERFEFWELRLSRLHDRFEYRKGPGDCWSIQRLYP